MIHVYIQTLNLMWDALKDSHPTTANLLVEVIMSLGGEEPIDEDEDEEEEDGS